ncbi:PREDICTED: bromodomain and PHD finger-containing protein 3-like isoform X2 [Tarenaya hassleriana]|uniref:bromodomain and PHD finger-containing protein 3-like isoform X2 n=1 Tax=Tarenaya hassleriana TaxID=28532 RepID=UPI00053C3952|nr:PREDICTED: bromodomain and PHD finger-containing protein 3-like isoform X2 [Tarenaya hassleriana]
MKVPKSERATEMPALQVYSRDSKRKKLATKLVQQNAGGDPLGCHPCNVEQLTSMPSTSCMPDKRILELILDILQRRDTHEIFAQPVDANEVEGYYEIIKEPMDFGTMRAKLHEGMYSGLEEFEHDVFLMSRNAMQFNSSSTIYFRQARAIHELAKRVFHTLKTDPEVFGSKFSQTRRRRKSRRVKSGDRVSSNNCQKPMMPHSTSKDDNLSGSYTYEAFAGDIHRESESSNTRRSTYIRLPSFLNEEGNTAVSKRLMPVVDLAEMGYKESLMMFSKSLGPTAQRIAAHKLQFASSSTLTADAAPFEPASYGLSHPFRMNGVSHSGSASSYLISSETFRQCQPDQN